MIKYISLLLIPCLLYSVDTREIKQDLEKPSIQRPSKSFPKHWGSQPDVQVRDIVKLPDGFGKGSSTLAEWIKENIKNDKENRPKRPELPAEIKEKINQVIDKEKVLRQAKQELFEKLKESKELTKEEKQELIEKFKRDNAENHKQLKEAQKELQKKIRETKQEADRRI